MNRVSHSCDLFLKKCRFLDEIIDQIEQITSILTDEDSLQKPLDENLMKYHNLLQQLSSLSSKRSQILENCQNEVTKIGKLCGKLKSLEKPISQVQETTKAKIEEKINKKFTFTDFEDPASVKVGEFNLFGLFFFFVDCRNKFCHGTNLTFLFI